MIGLLFPLVVIGLVVGVGYAVRSHIGSTTGHYRGDPVEPDGAQPPVFGGPVRHDLARSLTAWRDAGLISDEQADAIEAFEAELAVTPARPARRVPLVAEALGYLGGILGSVGLVLLIARYWPDLSTGVRAAIPAAVAVVLTVAGFLVPDRGEATFERLRGAAWLAATVGSGVLAGVLVHDLTDRGNLLLVFAASAAVAVHSLGLWRNGARPVQQFTFLAALCVAVGTGTAEWWNDSMPGVAVGLVGLPLLVLGLLHLTSASWMTMLAGAMAMSTGCAMATDHWRGLGLLALTLVSFGLLTLAGVRSAGRTRTERVLLTVMGLFWLPQGVLNLAGQYHDWSIVVGLSVWAVGAAALLAAEQPVVHTPRAAQMAGAAGMVAGAAMCGFDSVAFATIAGLLTAIGLVALSTTPRHVLVSMFGSIGLLVNVPWAIRHFFPGEGRVPLLILVSGVVIVAVAVWLTRLGGELRHEFHHPLRLRHH